MAWRVVASVAAFTWVPESCSHCHQQTAPDKIASKTRKVSRTLTVSSQTFSSLHSCWVGLFSPLPQKTQGVKGLPWQNFIQQQSLGSPKGSSRPLTLRVWGRWAVSLALGKALTFSSPCSPRYRCSSYTFISDSLESERTQSGRFQSPTDQRGPRDPAAYTLMPLLSFDLTLCGHIFLPLILLHGWGFVLI